MKWWCKQAPVCVPNLPFPTPRLLVKRNWCVLRAACCNLGESFSTNPSVDVSYSDAATGAFRYTDARTLYDNSSYPTYFQLQAQIKSTFADFAEAFKKIGYSITAIKE